MTNIKDTILPIIMFFILLYGGYIWAGQLWPIAENATEISHQIFYKIAITTHLLFFSILIPIFHFKGQKIEYQNVMIGPILMTIGILLAEVLMNTIWNLTTTLGGTSDNINIIGIAIISLVALMILVIPNGIMLYEKKVLE